jgi:hypothetical protein
MPLLETMYVVALVAAAAADSGYGGSMFASTSCCWGTCSQSGYTSECEVKNTVWYIVGGVDIGLVIVILLVVGGVLLYHSRQSRTEAGYTPIENVVDDRGVSSELLFGVIPAH